ncbi:hypothetical protein MHYP_G00311000 [Metynnis hypsauchen]
MQRGENKVSGGGLKGGKRQEGKEEDRMGRAMVSRQSEALGYAAMSMTDEDSKQASLVPPPLTLAFCHFHHISGYHGDAGSITYNTTERTQADLSLDTSRGLAKSSICSTLRSVCWALDRGKGWQD